MAAGRFQAVRHLFLDALERPGPEREAFVRESTPGDPALRGEVLALLAAHTESRWLATDAPFAEDAAPERIGPHRVIGELGRGGMGVVYRAMAADGTDVAIKLSHRSHDRQRQLRRFDREADALATLSHPAFARYVGRGVLESPGGPRPWIAMEYVAGVPLRAIADDPGVPLVRRVDIVARLADAVHHAHEHGLLHRDIKPSNILVRPDGQPCLLDLGILRDVGAGTGPADSVTTAGVLLGTTPYMSPEQARGRSAELDARSDVYSLAVTGFELLTGVLPHEPAAATQSAILLAILTQRARPLREAAPALPRVLERVFAHALEREPAARYDSAQAFADDLRAAISGRPVRAPTLRLGTRIGRRARRHRRAIAFAAVLVAASATLFAHTLWTSTTAVRDERTLTLELDAALLRLEPSIRGNERTIAGLDAAIGVIHGWQGRLRAVQSRPWARDLRRVIHWRLSEIRIWRAELTADRNEHQRCIAELRAMRALQPPAGAGVALADSSSALGALARFTARPECGLGLMSAAHEALAGLERPRPHVRAMAGLVLQAERLRLGLTDAAGESLVIARATAAVPEREADAIALHGLGAALAKRGALERDAAQVRSGLRVLRFAERAAVAGPSPAPRAALRHSIGEAHVALAEILGEQAHVDSALTAFDLALHFRRRSAGNLSYHETRRALAEALRVRARLEPARAAEALGTAAGLLEADLRQVRGDAHPAHRGWLLLELAGCRLDAAEATHVPAGPESLLAEAGGIFAPARFPAAAGRVALERVRVARLTGDRAGAARGLARLRGLVRMADDPRLARAISSEEDRLAGRGRTP